MLGLLSKLATSPLVARQMLHQGLEDTLGLVKSRKPLELHVMADEVLRAVLVSISSLKSIEPLEIASDARYPPDQSAAQTPASVFSNVSIGGLARPLENEFALALTRPSNTPVTTTTPASQAVAFGWSPARPRASGWVDQRTEPRTQNTATRGTLLSSAQPRPCMIARGTLIPHGILS